MPKGLRFPYGQDEFGRATWIGVICDDVRAERRFYEHVLRMVPVAEDSEYIQYSLGGIYMLELIKCDRTPDYPTPGVQIGFEHPQLGALKSYLDRLGVPTMPLRTGYQTQWFKARDPEGNIINFTSRSTLKGPSKR